MSNSQIATPGDLMAVGSKLLEVLSLLSNEKIRLVALLKSEPQPGEDAYGKNIHSLVVRGMAYEERRLMMELKLRKEIWDAKRRLEVLEAMLDTCRQYLMTLRVINSALDLDAKLSFEGHE